MKIDQLKGDIPVRISQNTLDALSSRKVNPNARTEGQASVFSVRYGFRPDSLDETKPFQLSKENEEYVIEGQGVTKADPQVFRGQATESKSTDYVLVLDESSGSFELLPLDSTLRVNRSREKPKQRNGITMPTAGSSKSPSPASSHSRSISPIEKIAAAAATSTATSKPEVPSISTPTVPPPQTSQAKPRKKAQVKKEPVSVALKKKKAPVKKSVASKKPPAAQPTTEVSDEDEVDEELMGALENELEGSLEDETNNNAIEESEESDEDEDVKPGVLTLEPEARQARPSFVNNAAAGPISLRGYVSGSRPEEEDLSSSEEE